MPSSQWPTTDAIVSMSYEAVDRGAFRQQALRWLMEATGSEFGLFSDMNAPVEHSDLINISVSSAERSRQAALAPSPLLDRMFERLTGQGAAIDTELYSAREFDRLPMTHVQREYGVKSNLAVMLPSMRGGPRMLCLSRTSSKHRNQDLKRMLGLLRALAVADSAVAMTPAVSSPHTLLTKRQLHIASLTAEGWSNPQIARMCGLSANTVRNHLAQIFKTLEVATRTELAVLLASSRAPASFRHDG
jgi:DNA-binding CsgD family transcriptional regulator